MKWFFKDTLSWFDFIGIILCTMMLMQGNFVVATLAGIVGGIISHQVQRMLGLQGGKNDS